MTEEFVKYLSEAVCETYIIDFRKAIKKHDKVSARYYLDKLYSSPWLLELDIDRDIIKEQLEKEYNNEK